MPPWYIYHLYVASTCPLNTTTRKTRLKVMIDTRSIEKTTSWSASNLIAFKFNFENAKLSIITIHEQTRVYNAFLHQMKHICALFDHFCSISRRLGPNAKPQKFNYKNQKMPFKNQSPISYQYNFLAWSRFTALPSLY